MKARRALKYLRCSCEQTDEVEMIWNQSREENQKVRQEDVSQTNNKWTMDVSIVMKQTSHGTTEDTSD